MGLTSSNFFYYKIKAYDSNRKEVSFAEILKKLGNLNSEIKIKGENNRTYGFEFNSFNLGGIQFYYGRITRSRSSKEHFLIKEKEKVLRNLADVVGEGETGLFGLDVVTFAITEHKGLLYVIIEQGYQYPGVGKFIEYLTHLSRGKGWEFESESLVKESNRKPLERVYNKKLYCMSMVFKKNSDYTKSSAVEGFMKKMDLTNKYVFSFNISMKHPKKKATFIHVKDALSRIFDVPTDEETLDNLLKIDFPSILNTFTITGFDEKPNVSITKNILNFYEKETINVDKTELAGFDELGEQLCQHLSNEIAEMDR